MIFSSHGEPIGSMHTATVSFVSDHEGKSTGSEHTTLLRPGQDMLRNMAGRAWAAATEAWPVINVNEVQRPVGRHQTIPTIDV